jgi:purine-binding chemotaxis protein CheW
VVNLLGDAFGIAAEQVDGRQELLRSTLSSPPPGPFLHLTPDRLTVLDVSQLGTPSAERRG